MLARDIIFTKKILKNDHRSKIRGFQTKKNQEYTVLNSKYFNQGWIHLGGDHPPNTKKKTGIL